MPYDSSYSSDGADSDESEELTVIVFVKRAPSAASTPDAGQQVCICSSGCATARPVQSNRAEELDTKSSTTRPYCRALPS